MAEGDPNKVKNIRSLNSRSSCRFSPASCLERPSLAAPREQTCVNGAKTERKWYLCLATFAFSFNDRLHYVVGWGLAQQAGDGCRVKASLSNRSESMSVNGGWPLFEQCSLSTILHLRSGSLSSRMANPIADPCVERHTLQPRV